MHIEANSFVRLDYVLSGESGEVLDDSSREGGTPIEYVHGYGMLVPGLEAKLAGLSEGDERQIDVVAEDGYGEYDEELVFELHRSELDGSGLLQIGDELRLDGPGGETIECEVLEIRDESVVLDANHPLAGQPLRYSVRVLSVRAATAEEIERAAQALEEAEACGCGEDHHDHAEEPAPEVLVPLRRKAELSLN